MRQELDRLDESHAGRGASFDAKSKDASRTSREVALRQRLVAISLQQRVADPVDTGMRSEMPSDGQCRLAVAWHAQVQRLDPLQQQERAKRSERRPKRSHGFHASFHGEAEIAEGLVEDHSMIATRWCGHLRELAVSPVKLSGLDDDSAHGRAVTAQVLGRGMNYDVGAVLQRSAEKRRSECVVDDQRNACVVRDRPDRRDIEHVELRVADRFRIHSLGFGANRAAKLVRVVGIDEAGGDAELGEGHRKLRIGAAVERARGDDVVAVLRQR